ncbi:MAG: hypothetical protein QGI78_03270 [Phycisphaerales bacterium]|jgi:hypothetical protein|nr:hypothetical protein [Phycisphaerales bacterium]
MAIRSGAGTGVIVSLVVFVLTTVFLLVLSIVFYTSKADQKEIADQAKIDLETFITSQEQNLDSFQRIVASAKADRVSVAAYLNGDLEKIRTLVSGSPDTSTESIKTQFSNELSTGGSLFLAFDRLNRQVQERQQELDSRISELSAAREQIASLEETIRNATAANMQAIEASKNQWNDIQNESELLAQNMDDHFESRVQRDDRLLGGKTTQISQLKSERDRLIKEKTILANDAADLRDQVNASRMSSIDPALLVDGNILDATATDRVFVDIGSKDHIVLGMTFEIYDDPSQLRVNEDGELPRGKASIEIIKVGETTATAKVTRSTPGRPIVRDNIIVNAVFDPNYRYKFMVHGLFDADGDGVTEHNNSFIKDRIASWGGIVVEEQDILPGDLDFLVLGVQPLEPRPLPRNASDVMIDEYARKQQAYSNYSSLLEQAQDVKIPVLNSNRLHVLTGQAGN